MKLLSSSLFQSITHFIWLIIKKVMGISGNALSKEETFRLGAIMRSSHNVHLSNQNMKCSPGVAL